MAWSSAQQLVALDAAHAAVALVTGSRGSRRLTSLAVVPLAPGVVTPGASAGNLADPARAEAALRAVLDRVGGPRSAVLLLPQTTCRTLVLDLPRGADVLEHGRFRLSGRLPYPVAEARVQAVPLGGTRHLVAAVRATVVEAYEVVARRAGVEVERVDLAHLAALAALQSDRPQEPLAVDVVLGDECASFVAWSDREVRVFRTRRRDTGAEAESDWIHAEALRTAAVVSTEMPSVRVVGRGAGSLLAHLSARGHAAFPGFTLRSDVEGASPLELAWLGAALA